MRSSIKNRTAVNMIINTGIQETVKKKKATFEFDNDLHTRLKVHAASNGVAMVEVVEQAVKEYLDRHPEGGNES